MRFFDHQLAKLLLIFVRDQCKYFETAIRRMEGSHVSAYEAAQSVFSLCSSIRERMEEKFTSFEFQHEMVNVAEGLPFTDTVLKKNGKRVIHEQVTVNEEYIDEIIQRFQSSF